MFSFTSHSLVNSRHPETTAEVSGPTGKWKKEEEWGRTGGKEVPRVEIGCDEHMPIRREGRDGVAKSFRTTKD